MKSRAFSDDELVRIIRRLRQEQDSMFYALFCTLYFLGVRVSEALTMTRGTVLDAAGNIRPEFCFLCLKKRRKEKVFRKCPPELAGVLRLWLDEMTAKYAKFDPSDFLFCSKWQRTPICRGYVSMKIKAIAREVGADPKGASSHSPRKTFAFRLYQEAIRRMNGKTSDPLYPVRTVQKALHHEDPRTTLSYLPDSAGPVDDYFEALSIEKNTLQNQET